MNTPLTPEMESLKTRLKATWMAGDYGVFAKYLEPGALEFLARLDLKPATRMLDVGCGAGQIAIPAARAGVTVTGVDIAANLIEQARARAATEGLTVRFDEGDAEMLPYDEAAFDVVVSLIGAMFAPRPERVAAELVRVCRPGGRIVMANWTPIGFVGQMFKVNGKHVPPPALMPAPQSGEREALRASPAQASLAPAPVLWGDEATVRERFNTAGSIAKLEVTRRLYPLKYSFGVSEVVEYFRTYYGPTQRAFAALDEAGQAALRRDLEQLWRDHNRSASGVTQVESEYLEIVAIRQ